MAKKVRKVPMQPSPSNAYHQVREDARARLRYQYLLQDYDDLLKETEEKKKNLQKAKQKKLRLLAEVKFLLGRYQSLLENPSQTTFHRLKKQLHKTSSPIAGIVKPARLHVPNEVSFKGKNHSAVEAAKPSTSTMLDLNQISLPSGEDVDFQSHMESLKPEMSERHSMDGGPNNRKFAVCRDEGSSSNRASKRKITWQDQVALKV
ncbi:unnamed protein product [Musa acuminata subsp. malaccensis]|uniref:(wild Malaysian banana) hypothetical protein n=1 Tax=Musa acuminata subsp. malaccensis TaxID=214687 RepID=A0A804KRL1_MUSAM|nr:PREDICTED: uncharacterized protein LOC104000088 [Musa acuminata subsp. malaccensis]CAG1852441.1 unnamed protein product [Musa acuminata subsp. malaccensis]